MSGLGLEAQELAVVNFLKDRGGDLLASYTDVETGTRRGNDRPQLAKAVGHCKRERAILLIAKLDRLSRNVYFVSGLMESGIDFIAVDMPSANRLTIHILAAVAEEEARMISRRTKEALAAAKVRGVRLGRPENLTPEAQAKAAQAVRDKAIKAYSHISQVVVTMRAQGTPYWRIAAHLNASGERTRNGADFDHKAVMRIFARTVTESLA